MCMIAFLVFVLTMIVLATVAFVKTALIALPYTLSAAILSVIAGLAAHRFTVGDAVKRSIYCGIAAIALTFGLGYVFKSAIPINPVPKKADLMSFPEPDLEKINEHFPSHLAIWSLLAGCTTTLITYPRDKVPESTRKGAL